MELRVSVVGVKLGVGGWVMEVEALVVGVGLGVRTWVEVVGVGVGGRLEVEGRASTGFEDTVLSWNVSTVKSPNVEDLVESSTFLLSSDSWVS